MLKDASHAWCAMPCQSISGKLAGTDPDLGGTIQVSVCRCIKAGRWLTAGRVDVWVPAGEGHRVFQGHRVFLSGSAAALEPLRSILPYAGMLRHVGSDL